MNRGTRIAAILAVSAFVVAPSAADTVRSSAAGRGASFLAARQVSSGAFFTADAPADSTADAIAAIVAGRGSAQVVERGLGYVARGGAAASQQGAGNAGRIVLGLIAAGRDPRNFSGVDYVAKVRSSFNPVSGEYDSKGLYADALAVLSLAAARDPIPESAVTYFRLNTCRDGGFGHQRGCVGGPDTDTTAMTLIALVRAGVPATDALRADARTGLKAMQSANGGFKANANAQNVNANSTALALSAMATLGEDPRTWRGDALATLLSLQMSDGGFRYLSDQPRANDYATVQATPAVAGLPYPILPQGSAPLGKAGAAASQAPAPIGGTVVVGSSPGVRKGSATAIGRPEPAAVAFGGTAVVSEHRASRTVPLAAAWICVTAALASHGIRLRRKRRAHA